MRVANRFADAKIVLEEFGQDIGKMSNQISRFASSTSGAFNLAVEEASKNQSSPVFAMQQARRGAKAAADAAQRAGLGKNRVAAQKAKAFFLGSEVGGETYQGFVDSLPAMRGFTHGFRSFRESFKVMKQGYDVVSGAKSFDDAVNAITRGPTSTATEQLQTAIRVVQGQHKSKFSAFAESVGTAMGKGGPANVRIDRTSFARQVQENEYRKQLKAYLVNNNADSKVADEFSRQVRIGQLPTSSHRSLHVSERIGLGKTKILAESDDDFYEQLATRFRKQVGAEKAPSADVLRRSIEETDNFVTRREFRQALDTKKSNLWNTFYNENVASYGNTILKPQKAVYQDFVGPLTAAKENFLRRRTAQVLGIDLVGANGRAISNKVVNQELTKRGFDT